MRVPKQGGCWSALAVGIAVAWVCAGCGSHAGDLEVHRAQGIRYYTRYIERGTPIAGPDTLAGRFVVEDGCVVLRWGRFTAIPIFIPAAKVSEDGETLTVGHTVLSLKGDAAEVGGELLSRRQAANLGYDLDGACGRHPFAFVYG